MKRSEFLKTTAVLGAGTSFLSLPDFAEPVKKPIRLAHFTDMHVKPGKDIESAVAKAFHHVQQQNHKPDFIVNGGDAIMDALEADKAKTQQQWDLLHRLLKNENSLPIYHCIGNHDVWGWFVKENLPDRQAGKPDADRLYGKAWAVETLQLKKRYYSFTKGKWHFIVLDSTQLNPAGGYIGKLDEEQFSWLQQELDGVPREKFISIISHIPVLSICASLFFDKNEPNGDFKIQRNLMHSDFLTLKKLFLKYPNIKTCLSGHIHLQDELQYLGIKYYCDGAISGNWWKGNFQEFAPAYAIIEFFDDGNTRRTMFNY